MAKVLGALLSLGAKGSVGKILTFQQRPGGGFAVYQQIKSHSVTGSYQVGKQEWYREGVEHWHLLTDDEKEQWALYVDSRGNTGYHAFISQYVRHLGLGQEPWKLPDGTLWEVTGESGIFGIGIFGQMIFGNPG